MGQPRFRVETLAWKLGHHKPDHLLVTVDTQDDPVRINMSLTRNARQRALKTLEDLNWSKVDLIDKKGGLMSSHARNVDDEPAPGDLEALLPSKMVAETTGHVTLILRAQDMVLQRHMATMGPVLDCLFKLIDVSMRRLDLVEKQYEHALRVNASMADDLVRSTLQLQRGSDEEHEDNAGPMMASLLPAMVRAALSKDGDGDGDKRETEKPKGRGRVVMNGAETATKRPAPEPAPKRDPGTS